VAYLVNIAFRAERDLEHLYNEIDAAGSDARAKMVRRVEEANSQFGEAA
jgi:hypothetical protein